MNEKKADLVIIGGGPAGMAAAIEASKKGIQDIVILEREKSLGESYSSAFTTVLAFTILVRS